MKHGIMCALTVLLASVLNACGGEQRTQEEKAKHEFDIIIQAVKNTGYPYPHSEKPSKVAYDITKTESLISPYTASIDITYIENEAVTTYFKYALAYQDGKWTIVSCSYNWHVYLGTVLGKPSQSEPTWSDWRFLKDPEEEWRYGWPDRYRKKTRSLLMK